MKTVTRRFAGRVHVIRWTPTTGLTCLTDAGSHSAVVGAHLFHKILKMFLRFVFFFETLIPAGIPEIFGKSDQQNVFQAIN